MRERGGPVELDAIYRAETELQSLVQTFGLVWIQQRVICRRPHYQQFNTYIDLRLFNVEYNLNI